MAKTFSQLTETINPGLNKLNFEFFEYVKDIKFKINEFIIKEFSFEYGEYIFKDGNCQLRKQLPDNYFSFGIILERGFETHLEGENFTPLHVGLPGEVFFIDEAKGLKPVRPQKNLNMTAGARSICVSAKIGDTHAFRQLVKYYHLNPQAPKSLASEWAMLCQLAHNANCSWRARVLTISVEKTVFLSERCNRLRHALRQSCAPYQILLENKLCFDFNMKSFMSENAYKTPTAIMEHIKQLYFISEGYLPGFSFATDELLAPIDLFKEALIRIYGITYAPSIVQPAPPESDRPCYYPLQNNEQNNGKRSHTSGLEELKEVQKTLPNFELFLARTVEDAKDSLFFSKSFSFFHHHPDPSNKVRQSAEIAKFDPAIDTDLETSKLPFCDSSPIFRAGCVAIKSKMEASHGA